MRLGAIIDADGKGKKKGAGHVQQVHGDELTLAQMFSSANPNAMMRRGSFDIDAIAAAKKKSGRISRVFKKGKARGKSILSNLTRWRWEEVGYAQDEDKSWRCERVGDRGREWDVAGGEQRLGARRGASWE